MSNTKEAKFPRPQVSFPEEYEEELPAGMHKWGPEGFCVECGCEPFSYGRPAPRNCFAEEQQ